ncbi:MAG: hypothetical protein AAFY88_27505, partial [Acidobacteriota bacterium]
AEPLSETSGLFWCFSPNHYEIIVKILNGCGVPGLEGYWVFFAAAATIELRVRVTDTLTGKVKEYLNPKGEAAVPVQDLSTFKKCQ